MEGSFQNEGKVVAISNEEDITGGDIFCDIFVELGEPYTSNFAKLVI